MKKKLSFAKHRKLRSVKISFVAIAMNRYYEGDDDVKIYIFFSINEINKRIWPNFSRWRKTYSIDDVKRENRRIQSAYFSLWFSNFWCKSNVFDCVSVFNAVSLCFLNRLIIIWQHIMIWCDCLHLRYQISSCEMDKFVSVAHITNDRCGTVHSIHTLLFIHSI